MRSLRSFTCFCFFIVAQPVLSIAGDSIPSQSLSPGFCFQKSIGFYWMNGVTAEYTSNKILKQKINLGFSFVSSKLGSAMASNAIPVYEARISAAKKFRSGKKLKPFAGLSMGFSHANFGTAVFKNIPGSSFLFSVIAGVGYDFKFPLRFVIGGGFNFITGNGISGLGTVFPVYGQCSLLYRIPFYRSLS